MPSVLLIGERSHESSHLARLLDKRGCECSFAASCGEAFLLLREQKFDLVLTPTSLRDGTLYPTMSLLERSGTTMYYSFAVEDGCWWLPALRFGQKCFGSPALRSTEFATLLDETIKETQRDVPASPRNQPLRVFQADAAVMAASRPRAQLMMVKREPVEKQELMKRKAAG